MPRNIQRPANPNQRPMGTQNSTSTRNRSNRPKDRPPKRDKQYILSLILRGIVLLFVLLVGAVAIQSQLLLRQAVHSISIEGNDLLAEDVILRIAGINKQQPLNEIDPYLSTTALLANQWIKNARVRVAPPYDLEVVIEERRPVAYLRTAKQVLFVDSEGVLLDPIYNRHGWDMPVISYRGITAELPVGGRLELDSFQQVMELFPLLKSNSFLPLSAVSEVIIENPLNIVLHTMPWGVEIHLGNSRFREKLLSLALTLPAITANKKRVSKIDLRYYNRISVGG